MLYSKQYKKSSNYIFLPWFYVKCGESERCWSLWGRRIFLFVGVEIEGEPEHPYMGMPSTFSPHWLQAFCSCLSTKWPSSIAFRGPTNYFCFGEIVLKLWLNNRDDHFFLDTVFNNTLLCSKQTYIVDKASWKLIFASFLT